MNKPSVSDVLQKYLIEKNKTHPELARELYREIVDKYHPKSIRSALKDVSCTSIARLKLLCKHYEERTNKRNL